MTSPVHLLIRCTGVAYIVRLAYYRAYSKLASNYLHQLMHLSVCFIVMSPLWSNIWCIKFYLQCIQTINPS